MRRAPAESDDRRIVVGLRNPGAEYEATRHNIGGDVVSAWAGSHCASFKKGPLRVRCDLATFPAESVSVVAALPRSFMNESGGPVRALLDYYKAEPSALLVVHDDIDIAFGRFRLQIGGGSGGHNGIRSIERTLGIREFARLKIGVGRPPGRMDPADYVLRRFARAEQGEVELMVGDAIDILDRWLIDPARAQEMAAHRKAD